MIIAANSVCLVQCVVFVTVEGIFLCLHDSRNAFWQFDLLWGLQKEPNAFLVLESCGMWSPPPSFPCSHLLLFLSFFCPQAFFHPLVCFVDQVYKTNLLFPNHSRAFWAVKVSLLPNMHEIVTVCLEAVCWACKFKPQSKDQRQMVKSSQSERPSWLFKSDDWISTLNLVHNGNTGKTPPWSSTVKNTLRINLSTRLKLGTWTTCTIQSFMSEILI